MKGTQSLAAVMPFKPDRFAKHYAQATLFRNSQTPIEQAHIVRAFRFELTKVQTPAVRERVVAMLANVSTVLAQNLATDLGMKMQKPLPAAATNPKPPEE
jgi:catalase